MIIGPRIGKFNRDGSSNPIIGHDISAVLIGCFILAFGWFGFNPGSTLGASAAGNLRIGTIAVDTMLAGCTGTFGAMLYMWVKKGKLDASMSGNGLAGRAGRDHRAQRLRQLGWRLHHRPGRRRAGRPELLVRRKRHES